MKKNLTKQQKKFCEEYASGKSASQAYKSAYNCNNKKNGLVAYEANKLLSSELISKEIEEIKNKKASFLNYTQEESFNKINALQALAEQKNDITNALKAEEMKQKLAGINKDNTSLNFGIVGDFKEFYAAICAKKDYGSTKTESAQSKNAFMSISPKQEDIEIK